jgi:hypothetical protein
LVHAQNGEEGRSAVKNLCCVRKTVRLAQEMGKGLGKCSLLFRQVPQSAIAMAADK